MQTVVELPEFLKQSEKLLDELEKPNLTKAECNELNKFTTHLVKNYGGQSE